MLLLCWQLPKHDPTALNQQTEVSAAATAADKPHRTKGDAAAAPDITAAAAGAADAENNQQELLDDATLEDHELDLEEDDELQLEQQGRSSRRQQQSGQTRANALDPSTLDPRRAKRILANRQSAQRSRMKRLQYIHDLENRSAATTATVKELQTEVQRLQERQTALADSVEARKTQVSCSTGLRCQFAMVTGVKVCVAWFFPIMQRVVAISTAV